MQLSERLKGYLEARLGILQIYTRLLALIYLVAFLSLVPQLNALWGTDGLCPLADFPLFRAAVYLGSAASLLALFKWRAPALALCYVCYLFVVWLGSDFLCYQWDILLLEVGAVSIFLCGRDQGTLKSICLILLNIVVVKLMFQSGLCKLASGDPTWNNLTALTYHFYTQPLPTPPSALLASAPVWFLKASCFISLFIELFMPLLVIMGSRARAIAAWSFIALQVAIILSGNYGFFNWLTIIITLPLFEDKQLAIKTVEPASGGRLKQVLVGIYLLLFAMHPIEPISNLYLSNTYGLFAVMTTSRPEIIIEGSMDGINYLPYEFPFKVGDLDRAPPVVAPYQPRLDWQLWFEALNFSEGGRAVSPWFARLLAAIKNNRQSVLSLLKSPFETAPRYLRVSLYDYSFDPSHKHVWQRKLRYIILEDPEPKPVLNLPGVTQP